MVGMKGGSTRILEVDVVTVDPMFSDMASKNSERLAAWMVV